MTTKKTILIVEDDPVDVILIERAFRRIQSDAVLRIVNDGDSAIAYLNGERQYSAHHGQACVAAQARRSPMHS